MKTITTTIAALLLATNASASDCASARASTQDLIDDYLNFVSEMNADPQKEKNIEFHCTGAQRRARSIQSSLISVKVFCHGNSGAIKWANQIEDAVEKFLRGPQ